MATAGHTATKTPRDRSEGAPTHGWVARPWVARAIRLIAMAVPVAFSFVSSLTAAALLPPTSSVSGTLGRWACVAVVSLAVFVVAERWFRRLLPLSSLFTMSLAFPDRTPSRFRLGLRTATTAELRRRTVEAAERSDETVDEAAQRLLELVARLSSHDRVTRGHSERVRAYSHMIGKEMGLKGADLERLTWSALLHDIGKIQVPRNILNKTGRLSDLEFEVIKTHPDEGRRLVEPLQEWLGDSLSAVWQHHERVDGAGYPAGLRGDEISLAARIVCVADAYDVMTAVRSYKVPMSAEAARAELTRCAGTQFDPDVVRAFLRASIDDRAWRGLAGLSFLPLVGRTLIAPLASSQGAAALGALALASGVVAAVDPAPIADALRLPPVSTVVADGDDGADDEDGDDPARRGDRPTVDGRVADGEDRIVGDDADGSTASSTPDGSSPGSSEDAETDGPDDGSAPDVTTPTVTTPTTPTTPPGTVPPVTTPPTGTAPPGTVSPPPSTVDVTVPEVTVPEVTMPPLTLPDLTLPPVSVPDVTVPTLTVPQVTIPQVTVPPLTIPQITVPQVTVPQVTVPPVTIPKVTILDVEVDVSLPAVTIPSLGGLGLRSD